MYEYSTYIMYLFFKAQFRTPRQLCHIRTKEKLEVREVEMRLFFLASSVNHNWVTTIGTSPAQRRQL
jgi:hypothetical protein